MSSTPDEITIEYEESGQILIKEIDKVILSKGAWTTILFRYQELDTETGGYGVAVLVHGLGVRQHAHPAVGGVAEVDDLGEAVTF